MSTTTTTTRFDAFAAPEVPEFEPPMELDDAAATIAGHPADTRAESSPQLLDAINTAGFFAEAERADFIAYTTENAAMFWESDAGRRIKRVSNPVKVRRAIARAATRPAV